MAFCRRLVALGAEVIVVSPKVIVEGALEEVAWIRATLADVDSVESPILQGDYVFHMVSTTVLVISNENPLLM